MKKRQKTNAIVVIGLMVVAAFVLAILPVQAKAVTIIDIQTGASVTGTWLPEPGRQVRLVPATGETIGGPFLPDAVTVYPNATTNYKGKCTNGPACDDPRDISIPAPDFDFVHNADGTATLTPYDYCGIAVVDVNGARTKFPVDSDNDGLPDSWEIQYYGNLTSVSRDSDTDRNPSTNLNTGDGLTAIDECRGFIMNGQYTRTDPTTMDLFVLLVPASPTSDLANLANPLEFILETATSPYKPIGFKIRRIYEYPDQSKPNEDSGDRIINSNTPSGSPPLNAQKAVRITEDLNPNVSDVGDCNSGTPNGEDWAMIYTAKINSVVDTKCATVADANCVAKDGTRTVRATGKAAVKKYYMKQVIAHEIGHMTKLTATYDQTYGSHYKPGSMYILDQFVKVSGTSTVTFSIPNVYTDTDKQKAMLRESQ